MKTLVVYSLSLSLFLFLSACSIYRIDVQQGNDITQDMINQLQPGMTKAQVAYVMRTPLLVDTFHPNRWDYIYNFKPGNGKREQQIITLHFDDNEKLAFIDGDIEIVEGRQDLPVIARQDKNIIVPLSEKKTGLVYTLLSFLGIGDDDDVEIINETQTIGADETDSNLFDKEIDR